MERLLLRRRRRLNADSECTVNVDDSVAVVDGVPPPPPLLTGHHLLDHLFYSMCNVAYFTGGGFVLLLDISRLQKKLSND